MKKRLIYETPEADVLTVLQEKQFLVSGDGYGGEKKAGQDFDTDSAHIYTDDF